MSPVAPNVSVRPEASAVSGPAARFRGPKPRPASWWLRTLAWTVAFLTLVPLIYLVVRALGMGSDAWTIARSPRNLAVLGQTVLLTLAVTASATAVGTALAWLTVRTDLPGRSVWAAATCLPLVLPSYVGAFALIAALGPHGMLQTLLAPLGVERIPSLYGFGGAWLALTLFTYPYVQLTVRAGLRGLDPSVEEAARSLGRTVPQVFRQIVLPHLRPALGAGALLVALYTLSDFGAVSLLQFDALTRQIHIQYSATLDREAAAVLALMLVALTLVLLAVEQRTRGRGRQFRPSAGVSRAPRRHRLGPWRIPALAFCGLVTLLGLGLPVLVTGFWLVRGWQAGDRIGGQWDLLRHSVGASGLAAVACVAAALPVVIYAVRHPGRTSRFAERTAYLGHAMPGIVVALALVFLGARVLPWLYQSLAMLVLAYVILFLPLAMGSVRACLLAISPRTEEAARTLGRSPAGVLRAVTLPQLRPGLLTGGALVFLSCMKELPATLLLGPTGFATLATRIWGATEQAFFARAAAPSLILVLVSAVSLAVLLRHEEEGLPG